MTKTKLQEVEIKLKGIEIQQMSVGLNASRDGGLIEVPLDWVDKNVVVILQGNRRR